MKNKLAFKRRFFFSEWPKDKIEAAFKFVEGYKKWILASKNAKNLAESQNLFQKAEFIKTTGSNFIMKNKKVSYFRQKPWALLTERPTSRNWVNIFEKIRTYFKENC